jgi:signal transduction histidine kinase
MVHLWPAEGADLAEHREVIDSSLPGVALAFDNIMLLGTVARRSVQDERSRVARGLHDDIGPALASLGLVVDVMVHSRTDPGLTPELRKLRSEITELVERVRATVADLRRADTTTVMDHVHRIVTELGDDAPRVVVAIDERSAADGTTAAEVGSVLVEAVRNAARHSGATQIRIEGTVDGATGELAVVDDGHGFDPQLAYAGHFGLVGMQERAAAIGGDLSISSRPDAGTRVTVTWGDNSR